MAQKSGSSKKKKSPARTKAKAAPKKTGSSKNGAEQSARDKVLEQLDRQQHNTSNFQSVVLFALAVLFFLIAFIHGSAGWYALHRFVRGVFGFSILLVPIILLVSTYYTEKRGGIPLLRKLLFSAGLTVLVSSFIQIIFAGEIEKKTFFRAVAYLYETGAEDAFHSGGVISALLAYPLIRILGVTGARILIVLLLFVAVMWMLDWNMHQLWYFLSMPFRKIRELWRQEANWAEPLMETDDETPEPEPELYLPPQVASEKTKRSREPAPPESQNIQTLPTPDPPVDIPPFVMAEDAALPPDLDEMIRNSYAQPAESAPDPPTHDMEVDLPIPTASPAPETAPFNPSKAEIFPDDLEPLPDWHMTEHPTAPYQMPNIEFLQPGINRASDPAAEQELKENAGTLVETLQSFGVSVRIVGIARGPAVTRYEIQPAAGIKVSKITNLADDIKLSLAAQSVRIEAPVPGKPVIGIEIPNHHKDTVSLREILESDTFRSAKSKLAFAVGKDIAGNHIVGDIADLPHMIIAGATGSGKSVCTNSIIMSLLYHAAPDEVKLILIDPKIVEFTVYEGIPHLLIPVVTDPKKAAGALNWAVQEMQRRYTLFAENSVRDLRDYNHLAASSDGTLPVMPQIVIIIDELADLMMTTSKEVEDAICRLAQKARAAGMHLIIATQRPTTDIITGLIKANIPSRIALSVTSQIDSRTILDTGGAEKLLGHGDMLYLPHGMIKPLRVQGCYVSTKEIEKVVDFIKAQTEGNYNDEIIEQVERSIPVTKEEQRAMQSESGAEPGSDEDILERAIELVVEAGQASTSSLQRRLKLGYARAARMMDELEQLGVIGPYEGAKPRKVLMTKEQLMERKMRRLP